MRNTQLRKSKRLYSSPVLFTFVYTRAAYYTINAQWTVTRLVVLDPSMAVEIVLLSLNTTRCALIVVYLQIN
jgi:hypothetical protein